MSPDATHIDDGLLINYLLNEATEEERLSVDRWLALSPENQKEFDRFKKVWADSLALATTAPSDASAAWSRFQQRVRPAEPVVSTKRRLGWLGVAAAVAVLAGTGWSLYTLLRSNNPTVVLQATNVVNVDTLPDGSVVTMNKNASLSHPQKFADDERRVSLQGEAFFNVVADKAKPFVITVNNVSVKVIGTSFNIRSGSGVTEVIVESGTVDVSRGTQTVRLRPRQKVSVIPADTALAVQREPDRLYNHYRTNEFVCDGTPLWKLMQVLSEAYGVSITIEREALRSLPLTTTFSNASLDNILSVVQETFEEYNIRIEKPSPTTLVLR